MRVITLTPLLEPLFETPPSQATVSGALARLVKNGDTFVRTAPGTYWLAGKALPEGEKRRRGQSED